MTVILYNTGGRFQKFEEITSIQQSGKPGQIPLFELRREKEVICRVPTYSTKLEAF